MKYFFLAESDREIPKFEFMTSSTSSPNSDVSGERELSRSVCGTILIKKHGTPKHCARNPETELTSNEVSFANTSQGTEYLGSSNDVCSSQDYSMVALTGLSTAEGIRNQRPAAPVLSKSYGRLAVDFLPAVEAGSDHDVVQEQIYRSAGPHVRLS
jgi:hypothetical protein